MVLTNKFQDVITWEAMVGTITNVSLRCEGEADTYGLWVKWGGVTVQSCDISSDGLACMQVSSHKARAPSSTVR